MLGAHAVVTVGNLVTHAVLSDACIHMTMQFECDTAPIATQSL